MKNILKDFKNSDLIQQDSENSPINTKSIVQQDDVDDISKRKNKENEILLTNGTLLCGIFKDLLGESGCGCVYYNDGSFF